MLVLSAPYVQNMQQCHWLWKLRAMLYLDYYLDNP